LPSSLLAALPLSFNAANAKDTAPFNCSDEFFIAS
jgi:hypothetical protein